MENLFYKKNNTIYNQKKNNKNFKLIFIIIFEINKKIIKSFIIFKKKLIKNNCFNFAKLILL